MYHVSELKVVHLLFVSLRVISLRELLLLPNRSGKKKKPHDTCCTVCLSSNKPTAAVCPWAASNDYFCYRLIVWSIKH